MLNLSSLANDVGLSSTTLRQWISVLKATYLVFELNPWFENISKRVVKSPKLYFGDVGLAAFLLGIRTADQAARDPLRGNLYENLIVADVMRRLCNSGERPDLHFFRDSHGNEVDLLIREGRSLIAVEIKSASTFSTDFLKGLNNFNALVGSQVRQGLVLFNGEHRHAVKGVQVLNPLSHSDWID